MVTNLLEEIHKASKESIEKVLSDETLQTGVGNCLLISMLKNLSLFCQLFALHRCIEKSRL